MPYFVAEVLLTWLILIGLGGLVIASTLGFAGIGLLLMIGFAAVALFGAIRIALLGTLRSALRGETDPTGIFGSALKGLGAIRRESTLPGFGLRESFAFSWAAGQAPDAYDVVDALAAHLARHGIRHSKSGGILVRDDGATWWLEPELGERRVTGWVECGERGRKHEIVTAVRDFLERDMGLRVA